MIPMIWILNPNVIDQARHWIMPWLRFQFGWIVG